jgi:hypothetical protein
MYSHSIFTENEKHDKSFGLHKDLRAFPQRNAVAYFVPDGTSRVIFPARSLVLSIYRTAALGYSVSITNQYQEPSCG